MASSGLLSNCLTYFIHLDTLGFPISGTMFSKSSNAKIDHGLKCLEAILPAKQMTIPQGKKACYHKNHLRFFYRVDNITGHILPNSLFSRIGKPKRMCSGRENILEYIIYS